MHYRRDGFRDMIDSIGCTFGVCSRVIVISPGRWSDADLRTVIHGWPYLVPSTSRLIVIVISELLERLSKAKRTRAPAYLDLGQNGNGQNGTNKNFVRTILSI